MNAQQKFPHTMFASFEILTPTEIRFFSFWGTQQAEATCETVEDRQLAEFFYMLNGGTNFFNCCLHIATTGCQQVDFSELADAPREFSEYYPAEMPGLFDFEGWKNALTSALDAESQTAFFAGLNQYFADFYNGQTIFERVTDRYHTLPVGTVLTDGNSFDVILQQNGGTTFMLAQGYPAAESSNDLYPIEREKLPAYLVKDLETAENRWNDQVTEEREKFARWQEKDAERAGKRAEKEAAKAAKATAREEAKVTKAAEKANAEKEAAEISALLLQEFFKLSTTATIDELKEWMAGNQKSMIGKGDNSDRKQATELYRTLKVKADAEAKAAEKAAKDAEKAETETAPEGTAEVQVTSAPTTKSRKKAPTAQTEPIEVETEVETV